MNDILLLATKHTPMVDFRFSGHRLAMTGEAYPENAGLFFAPLMERLKVYLAEGHPDPLIVRLELTYMNSASTKAIFQFIGLLDAAAAAGRPATLEFVHDPDDDMAVEFAEELKEDFAALAVKVTERA